MKIIYKKGNLCDAIESIIAHGCNNRGVMGSGVARAIRNTYPEAYNIYKNFYKKNGLKLGILLCWNNDSKCIINCITQDGFGKDGKKYVSYDAIRTCMRQINYGNYGSYGNRSVALPKIGAGLGGGDWNIISKIIEEEFTKIQPVVYES